MGERARLHVLAGGGTSVGRGSGREEAETSNQSGLSEAGPILDQIRT